MPAHGCAICTQSITNPVCVKCYIKEIYAWTQSMRMKEIPRNIVIEIIKRKLIIEHNNESKCILCEREDISICSYCFFTLIERTLNELNFSGKLIEEFKEIFNYNLAGDSSEYFNEIKTLYKK